MRKAQIHFSNSIETLVEVLKHGLYPENSRPFNQRMIVVPHSHLKTFIMQSFVEDKEVQIAAGLQIVSLSKAIERITNKTIPSKILLSLFIEENLTAIIEQYQELQEYFSHPAFEQRIGSFCDHLSRFFMEYGVDCNKTLLPWQERLWKEMKKKWIFPEELSTLKLPIQYQVHIFGFSYLPSCYLDFFHAQQAEMYFFSPCQIFWGDYFSQKKQIFLAKNLPENSKEDFRRSFEYQNFLLAHLGKPGQKMHLEIEEKSLPTEEHYVETAADTFLHRLQRDILYGESSSESFDATVRCFSAPSKLREVEILKEELLNLIVSQSLSPSDIQIFAPEINDYASVIHMVFGQIEPLIPYSIIGLELQKEDLSANALSLLLRLPQQRFSLDAVFSFLYSPPVREKLALSNEDLKIFRHWMETAHVEWGLSAKQRQSLSLREKMLSSQNTSLGTWQNGLMRLVLGLGRIEGELSPLNIVAVSQIEILEKFFHIIQKLEEDLKNLIEPIPQTIPQWLETLLMLAQQYLSIDSSHEISRDLLYLLRETEDFKCEKISWISFERIIQQILSKKSRFHRAPHLQAIHFASLSEGCASPSSLIHVLGLQESTFPRKEIIAPFNLKDSNMVSSVDQLQKDRYLFLELIYHAKEYFSLSYQTSEEDQPSLLITQILSQGEGGIIDKHGAAAFDPTYFLDKQSLSPLHYHAAKAFLNSQKPTPLIPEFYHPYSLILPKLSKSLTIEFSSLVKLAKHPLRFYFHEILKIYPEYKKPQKEYLVPSFTRHKLVKEALLNPIEKVLQRAQASGELPKNAFQLLMKTQIINEVEQWRSCLDHFRISQEDVGAIEFQLFCKKPQRHPQGTWIYPAPLIKIDGHDVHITGRIENCTPEGLLIRGKENLENLLKHWPHYLILKHLGLGKLIFIEEQKQFSQDLAQDDFEKYIRYFLLASSHASPLLPDFGKALLMGNSEDLHKAMKSKINDPDEIFEWLLYRDPPPNAKIIHDNWNEVLKNSFSSINDIRNR